MNLEYELPISNENTAIDEVAIKNENTVVDEEAIKNEIARIFDKILIWTNLIVIYLKILN